MAHFDDDDSSADQTEGFFMLMFQDFSFSTGILEFCVVKNFDVAKCFQLEKY